MKKSFQISKSHSHITQQSHYWVHSQVIESRSPRGTSHPGTSFTTATEGTSLRAHRWVTNKQNALCHQRHITQPKKEGHLTRYRVAGPQEHMPSEDDPVPEGHELCDHLCEVPNVVKAMETENRMLAARGCGRTSGSCCSMGTEFQFCKMKRVLWRRMVVTAAHVKELNDTEAYTSNA